MSKLADTPDLAYALGYYDALNDMLIQNVQVEIALLDAYQKGYDDGHEDYKVFKKAGKLREKRKEYGDLYFRLAYENA